MREDPVLQQEGGLVVTDLSGGLFSSIPEKNIRVVSAYLQLIVDVSSSGKGKAIKVLDVFMNARVIFADDYIKSTDIYWKEHLAGSLRESVDDHFYVNLLNALKEIPKRDKSDEAANFYKSLQDIKEFLNNLAHMRYELALVYVKTKYPDATEVTEEIFNAICKDMVDILFQWFSQHCYKGTN